MAEVGLYILFMSVYVVTGGLWIDSAIDQLKKHHYWRFGTCVMIVISIILCMIHLCFGM